MRLRSSSEQEFGPTECDLAESDSRKAHEFELDNTRANANANANVNEKETSMNDERRHRRSTQPAQALSLLLETCRARGNFDAIVVSDDIGLLVASASTPGIDVEEVAALLPEPEQRRGVRRLRTTAFGIDGQVLYVGAIGGEDARVAPEVHATLRGVRRILAA